MVKLCFEARWIFKISKEDRHLT